VGKVIIMSTSANVPLGDAPREFSREPLSDREVNLQIGYLLADIRESLGAMSNAIQVLENARRSYEERILQLTERTTRTECALPGLRDAVDRHTSDLNGLGKVAHTANTLVRIALAILAAIAGPALIYLYHHVTIIPK